MCAVFWHLTCLFAQWKTLPLTLRLLDRHLSQSGHWWGCGGEGLERGFEPSCLRNQQQKYTCAKWKPVVGFNFPLIFRWWLCGRCCATSVCSTRDPAVCVRHLWVPLWVKTCDRHKFNWNKAEKALAMWKVCSSSVSSLELKFSLMKSYCPPAYPWPVIYPEASHCGWNTGFDFLSTSFQIK